MKGKPGSEDGVQILCGLCLRSEEERSHLPGFYVSIMYVHTFMLIANLGEQQRFRWRYIYSLISLFMCMYDNVYRSRVSAYLRPNTRLLQNREPPTPTLNTTKCLNGMPMTLMKGPQLLAHLRISPSNSVSQSTSAPSSHRHTSGSSTAGRPIVFPQQR